MASPAVLKRLARHGLADLTPPSEDNSYDPNTVTDRTRTQIAWALLAITALIILATIGMSIWALSSSQSMEQSLKTILAVTNVLFGPIIAVLGSVIGFYFGLRAASGAGGPKWADSCSISCSHGRTVTLNQRLGACILWNGIFMR